MICKSKQKLKKII